MFLILTFVLIRNVCAVVGLWTLWHLLQLPFWESGNPSPIAANCRLKPTVCLVLEHLKSPCLSFSRKNNIRKRHKIQLKSTNNTYEVIVVFI